MMDAATRKTRAELVAVKVTTIPLYWNQEDAGIFRSGLGGDFQISQPTGSAIVDLFT